MATRDEVFASKYLKAADLKGRPRVMKIEECWQEQLKTNDGKEREKTIVKFAGEEKTLVMNMVNWDAIRLAKRMIVDGRMPAPEEALRQLRERQQRDRLGEPMPPIVDGVADLIEVPRKRP